MVKNSEQELAKEIGIERTDKLQKKNGKYVHDMRLVYDGERVDKMRESWKKTVEQASSFLKDYDKVYDEAVEIAEKTFEQSIDSNKKAYEDKIALPVEELKEQLYNGFLKEYDNFIESLKNIDLMREEAVSSVKKELVKLKQNNESEKKKLEGALHFWNNPKV